MLSADFRYDEELASMKALSRKVEYVAVRVLLAALAGSEKRILHHPSGKPYLEDGSFRITVSHTRGFVAVGLHPEREVGIDIEYMSERVGRLLPGYWDRKRRQRLRWTFCSLVCQGNDVQDARCAGGGFRPAFPDYPYAGRYGRKKIRGIEFRTSSRMQFDLSYWVDPDFVCTWSVGLQPSCE